MSSTLEADAESVLRLVTPSLDLKRHKGQAGLKLSPPSLLLFMIGFDSKFELQSLSLFLMLKNLLFCKLIFVFREDSCDRGLS